MLPMGRFVHVLERQGRRVKIDFPAKGWTSITTPWEDAVFSVLVFEG